MRLSYFLTIATLISSCTTLFKGDDHRIVKMGGKSSPSFASKGGGWLDLRHSIAEDDPINDILAMGRWSIASRKIKQRLSAKPGDEKLMTMLASALFMEKRQRAARFYANKVLQLNPNNTGAQNILALCILYSASNSNDYRQAVTLFKRVFNSSRKEIASGLNLGFLYLRVKNAFFAQEVFTEIIDRCSDCQAAYLGRGIAFYQLGKFKDAIAAFEDGLDIEASNEITYHLALVYRYGRNVRSLNKARALFSKIARNYNSPSYLRNKARAEMAIIDEKQMYRYQQKDDDSKDSFSDTYIMPSADEDFSIRK